MSGGETTDEYRDQKGGTVGIDMSGMERKQLFPDVTESYLQSRLNEIQIIEASIVELGKIFQQLALIVREQEKIVHRIDDNVEDGYVHVESAHDELLRYFRSMSSDGCLMCKIFAVMIIFLCIFALLLV